MIEEVELSEFIRVLLWPFSGRQHRGRAFAVRGSRQRDWGRFDLHGRTIAEVRLPTDLWTEGGVSELNLMQLEGQARASVRAMASQLRDLGRLEHWGAGR